MALSSLCEAVAATILLFDLLHRLVPASRPSANPGSPDGRTVTFIVPNYNQRHLMDFCLPPLLAEAGDRHRVLVVDDASTDDTVGYLRATYPQVRVVALSRNQGFGGAVRAGIAASDTPLFALINTDVQVRPGWLAAILPHFDRPDIFGVCSRIDLPGGSRMETGNVAAAWSGILEPYHVPPAHPGPILYAGGASSVYDRAKYDALGGFETVYRPMYFEDIELGYRAWRRGWRSLFEPNASVYHQRRAWIGTRFSDAQANETFLRNGLLFVWKNVRDPVMLAQNCAYVSARLVREVLGGEGTMARAFLRALPLLGRMLMARWRDHRRGDLADRQILAAAQPVGRGIL
jgi:GT2 family glycosyltransferase